MNLQPTFSSSSSSSSFSTTPYDFDTLFSDNFLSDFANPQSQSQSQPYMIQSNNSNSSFATPPQPSCPTPPMGSYTTDAAFAVQQAWVQQQQQLIETQQINLQQQQVQLQALQEEQQQEQQQQQPPEAKKRRVANSHDSSNASLNSMTDVDEAADPPAENTTNVPSPTEPTTTTSNEVKSIPSNSALGEGEESPQVVDEKRLKNREHAKRSRVRKKFMLESLQVEVKALEKENSDLRLLVREKIPDSASEIISSVCSTNPLFDGNSSSDDTDSSGQSSAKNTSSSAKNQTKKLDKVDLSLMSSLTLGQQNFVLTDPNLPDNPIVFASEGFHNLTGYTRDKVIGRNCRFLQGPRTDPKAVEVIRNAISMGIDATVCLLNYKEDGTPFWNQFFVAPLRDSNSNIVNFVGVQTTVDAPDSKADELLPLPQALL